MQGGQRHIRGVERKCASAASVVSRVNIIAAMMLSTANAMRVLIRPAPSPTDAHFLSGRDGTTKARLQRRNYYAQISRFDSSPLALSPMTVPSLPRARHPLLALGILP